MLTRRCAYGLFAVTCKLPIAVAAVTKLGDHLAVELENEDAAGLVVHHNYVTVPVHRHALGTHQLARADLVLYPIPQKIKTFKN